MCLYVSSCGTDVPVVFEMVRFAASAAAGAATYLHLGYGCKRRRLPVLGVDAVRFSTSYDAILNANLHPHDGSLCLLMSCLVQTFFFFHFLGNCLVRLFFSRIDSQSQYRKVMAFMSFPYGTRMPCSCVAYVV